jgi:hypothetical protein
MSMMLVTERPEPQQPQPQKEAPTVSSGSQDLNSAGESADKEAVGNQLPEPTPSPEPQAGSQLSEATSGPADQYTTVS